MIYGRDGPTRSRDNSTMPSPQETGSSTRTALKILHRYPQKKYVKLPNVISRKQQTTGWFIPEKKNTLELNRPHSAGTNYYRDPAIFGQQHSGAEAGATTGATAPSPVNFSNSMQTAKINGIQIVAIDLPIDGVVSFVGSFAAGDTMSPKKQPMLAGLTANMLDKGTKNRDRFEIAELLDNLGADMSFQQGPTASPSRASFSAPMQDRYSSFSRNNCASPRSALTSLKT